ncbi:MAG: hypothetical protein HZC29_03135, partial [Thaumarchaeota archaeon]|nr:hypothetical protein [Nitrososphaerota archaeon]
GFYEITAAVNASGRFGVADNWVQVSNTNIKTTTDRPKYLPSDTVTLTVQITNSSSGIGIPNASISVVADNSDKTAFGKTDASGKVVMTLDPSSYAGSGSSTWSFGWHNLKIEISKDTGTDVSKTQTWFGFDVRGENDLFIRPDKPVFSQSENVSLTIFGPPANSYSIAPNGIKVDGTTLTQGALNDCSVVSGSTFCMSDSWGKNVNLGNWSAGHHNLEFTISFGQGQQKFYTGFDVSLYNIMVTTDNFTYRTNSNVTLTVKVNHPNGTAVSNANVFATLYKAQPPNDIYVNQTNATTDSTGQVVLRLNASQPGFNYIKVNASGQLQFIGLQVSTIQVSLMSAATGGVVSNYNVAPGDTATIFVNATSGGSAVADGSIVKASTWAFGNQIDLPSNTTTGGISSISYQVPSFAPTQVYGLDVSVTTSGGDQGFAPQSSLTVTGGSAMQLSVSSDRSFMNAYKIGDIALFTATVRYSNGTGVSGQNITFELGSEGSSPQIVGAAITGSTGMASKTYTIGTNDTDGPYFLHAYICVVPDSTVHGLGETLVLNVTVTNRTSGLQINATSGFAAIFNKEKGAIQQFYDPTRLSQPYRINISIPNETTALGSYPIAVVMFMNNSQGTGFTLIDVRNGSQSLNITLPSTITAGTAFSVNISSLSGAAATLRIFSPSAQQVVYENTSITVTGGSILVPVNISNPGVYVFNAFVTGVGATTKVTT